MHTPRLIIGISGASGAIYGIRLLEALQPMPIETHLVISKAGALTITQETDYALKDVQHLADVVHPIGDVGASIASGSFKTMGMVIAPCSMKSVGELAHGCCSTLLTRAADVALKERRKLVILPRETPLHSVHLRNMATLSDLGAIIAPALPAFYARPKSLDEMVQHTVGRILDHLGLDHYLIERWQGLKAAPAVFAKND